MIDILIAMLQAAIMLSAIIIARWLLNFSSYDNDINMLYSIIPHVELRWYRWPEYEHQLRGQHILDMVAMS